MANAKISNYKMLSARFLLAGILFFSFIAIAGYRASSNSIFPQKGQTELIYSNKGPGANKTGLYRKVLLQKNKKAFLSHHNNLISLLIYNRLAKVKLAGRLKKLYFFSIQNRFLSIKNIPKNSEEDYFTSFTS